ncbi:glycosyltransferase family 2 protein [Acidovorax sp. FG27]|uniref:glycosyltransferase family 2 protein n=1 Tax=Acidovorax sp. FG27 TaxID=3133652 RepID=UPI0030E88397
MLTNLEALGQSQPALRIALIVPCYNEALAIGQVLTGFRKALPDAALHVFDNNSTDDTAAVARAHGAEVTHVRLRGKGNVVRRMFADVEADIYIMVDGDATYDAAQAPHMINMLQQHKLDMVIGSRVDDGTNHSTYRPGHRLGNRLLTGSVLWIFGGHFTDMLSGYRVFSRRYAKSFPASAHGFETETELTVHALELRMPYAEHPTAYSSRPEGSMSKLSTFKDGWRILKTIAKLVISEKPLEFFSLLALLLALISIGMAIPIALTYLELGVVPRLPTAVLTTGTMLSALLSLVCGAVLNTVTLGRREAKWLAYLGTPGPRVTCAQDAAKHGAPMPAVSNAAAL